MTNDSDNKSCPMCMSNKISFFIDDETGEHFGYCEECSYSIEKEHFD